MNDENEVKMDVMPEGEEVVETVPAEDMDAEAVAPATEEAAPAGDDEAEAA